ncbi:MAG: hypothetical protein NZM35_11065 [Chitinophagales bacterium]|nr:hypothetical protein [Chitinophagales bacterium]MDW8419884.1 hypothetical protein [Chitinophagales bacterium]
MSKALEHWNPPVTDKPDYFDTVKYIYKYIEFHISEDEAYTILNAFIEKWDASAGQLIREEELTAHVVERLQNNYEVLLPAPKIKRVVELILGYLFETGHFFQQETDNQGGR